MTVDSTLKFVLIDKQTGKALARFRTASRYQPELEQLADNELRMRVDGALTSAWIPHIAIGSEQLKETHLDFTVDFATRDWADVHCIPRGFIHQSVRLTIEPMQSELFHEEHDEIGAFINQRLKRDSQGIRRGML